MCCVWCLLQLLQEEVKTHEPDHQALHEAFTIHSDTSKEKGVTTDLQVIEDEVANIDERYDDLRCDVDKRLRQLNDVQDSLHGYQETLMVVEQTLEEVHEFVVEKYVLIVDVQHSHEELGKAKVRVI
jgi:DNA repair ATPase RecN